MVGMACQRVGVNYELLLPPRVVFELANQIACDFLMEVSASSLKMIGQGLYLFFFSFLNGSFHLFLGGSS